MWIHILNALTELFQELLARYSHPQHTCIIPRTRINPNAPSTIKTNTHFPYIHLSHVCIIWTLKMIFTILLRKNWYLKSTCNHLSSVRSSSFITRKKNFSYRQDVKCNGPLSAFISGEKVTGELVYRWGAERKCHGHNTSAVWQRGTCPQTTQRGSNKLQGGCQSQRSRPGVPFWVNKLTKKNSWSWYLWEPHHCSPCSVSSHWILVYLKTGHHSKKGSNANWTAACDHHPKKKTGTWDNIRGFEFSKAWDGSEYFL